MPQMSLCGCSSFLDERKDARACSDEQDESPFRAIVLSSSSNSSSERGRKRAAGSSSSGSTSQGSTSSQANSRHSPRPRRRRPWMSSRLGPLQMGVVTLLAVLASRGRGSMAHPTGAAAVGAAVAQVGRVAAMSVVVPLLVSTRPVALLLGGGIGVGRQWGAEAAAAGDSVGASCCNGNGVVHLNRTCSCFSGYTGPTCLRKVCPAGPAWSDIASATDTAHAADTECSNMGTCDHSAGTCTCRAGFEGLACERMTCPSAVPSKECSGHGVCLTMSQAASNWDGRNLVRPNVAYTYPQRWDADMIQGCVCDWSYSGYDCSRQSCPTGDDPLTTGQQNEKMRVVCLADSGSFTFSFRGFETDPIPANSSYGYVEYLLEDLTSIRDVEVSFDSGDTLCGKAEAVTTTIEFMQEFGDLPAAKVRSVDLSSSSGGGEASVLLETRWEWTCPVCSDCRGGLYVLYDGAISSKISHNATYLDVTEAIAALPTLRSGASVYGNITAISTNISASPSGFMCDSSQDVVTIVKAWSQYGNLPNITVINSVYDGSDQAQLNFTFPKGTKEDVVCSNHGTCDWNTATCTCAMNVTFYPDPGDWYFWESSDGYGQAGDRGDCGSRRTENVPYLFNNLAFESYWNTSLYCPSRVIYDDPDAPTWDTQNLAFCGGFGACNNDTGGCDCDPGRFGHDCNQKRCPTGKAWFDEAFANNAAHAHGSECANNGICDYSTGRCSCRTGYTGAACDRMTCEDNCGGMGRCLPMFVLAQSHQAEGGGADGTVSYGYDADLIVPFGQSLFRSDKAWDFDMVHGCLCDTRDEYQPYNGPTMFVSGVWTDNERLGGRSGYNCKMRNCPTGDRMLTGFGRSEVQTIRCNMTDGDFRVSFRGQESKPISVNATAEEVQSAIQNLTTVGQVTVNFTNGAEVACSSAFDMGEGIAVTFITELGDLPALSTDPFFWVNETTKGTKDDIECGGQGYCDYDTGLCECVGGFASSDGNGGFGLRGDCSFHDLSYNELELEVDILAFLEALPGGE